MFNTNRLDAGANIISAAVGNARTFAAQDIQFVNDLDTSTPGDQFGTYDGVAVLFTPQRELRLVINDETARNHNGNFLELLEVRSGSGWLHGTVSGYKDMEGWDYISLPKDVNVLGVARFHGDEDSLHLLAAPFAIRFNEHGNMIIADDADEEAVVVYDGDADGTYYATDERSGSRTRPSSYSADEWDPNTVHYSGDYEPDTSHTSPDPTPDRPDKHKIPFDMLECVVGVLVFNDEDFREAGYDLMNGPDGLSDGMIEVDMGSPGDPASDPGQWLIDNGKILLFNRFTGSVLRDQQ